MQGSQESPFGNVFAMKPDVVRQFGWAGQGTGQTTDDVNLDLITSQLFKAFEQCGGGGAEIWDWQILVEAIINHQEGDSKGAGHWIVIDGW